MNISIFYIVWKNYGLEHITSIPIKQDIAEMDKKTARTPQLLTQSWNTGLYSILQSL